MFEENIVVLAVALLAGVVQNHPFEQGNKRVGLVAARNFLQNNGYAVGPAIMDFAAGHIDEDDLVEILEEHLIDAS